MYVLQTTITLSLINTFLSSSYVPINIIFAIFFYYSYYTKFIFYKKKKQEHNKKLFLNIRLSQT